jgi:uncharacterized damage-inducible protein DinB
MDRELIEQYAQAGEKLSMVIRGLTREDLLAAPDPDAGVGKWSIQQVVLHLSDCDLVFADRMKRVIAEDNPMLMEFSENHWAAALHYEEQSAEDAVKLLDLSRNQIALILRKLPDAAFKRSGTHSSAGKKTLLDLVSGAVRHFEHHLKFIHAKREKMGKEMW